jgi:hypothetical protein
LSKLDIHARGVERSVCVFTVWALDGRKASTRRGKGLNLKGFCSTLRSIEKGTFDHEAPSIWNDPLSMFLLLYYTSYRS